MSSLIAPVCRIEEVKPHPNADRLDIAIVKGWQCVVGRGAYKPGDLITYIPPDSIIPTPLADSLGVTKYLSNGRVRCARLRGEPSYGVIAPPNGQEGDNAADALGLTKWTPPLKLSAGDQLPDHPAFGCYTDIENMRHYPDLIPTGEEVVATEKIHGTNCRVGFVEENGEMLLVCGSKSVRRPTTPELTYSTPLSIEPIQSLLDDLYRAGHKQATVFGEIYGKVQSLRYGLPNSVAFRAFDIMVEGRYMDAVDFEATCDARRIDRVPVLYHGPMLLDVIREMSNGRSCVPGAANIREGVVVRPIRERYDPKIGRVILKYVGDDYLCGGNDDNGE